MDLGLASALELDHMHTTVPSSPPPSMPSRHRLHGFSGCFPALEIAVVLGIEFKFNSNCNGWFTKGKWFLLTVANSTNQMSVIEEEWVAVRR
ncbi:hypothetical protein HN51_000685 [Arachis hypogaea]